MRKFPISAAVAAKLSQKARQREAGLALYLPAYDERPLPPTQQNTPEDDESDESYGVTICVDDNDLV